MSLPDRAWDPVSRCYRDVLGERTVGTSVPPHTVRGVRMPPKRWQATKAALGACIKVDACNKIAGHTGECS